MGPAQIQRAVGRALYEESVATKVDLVPLATKADLDTLAERIIAEREPGNAAPPIEQLKGALAGLANSQIAAKAEALALIEDNRLEEGLAKLRAFAEQQSDTVGEAARQTADTWRQLGLLSMTTDVTQAAMAFEEAERVSPGDFRTLGELCRLYCFALRRIQPAADLIPRLIAAASDDRERSIAFEIEGDILSELGELDKAIARYKDSLDITRKLLFENPERAEHARDLVVDLRKFGLAFIKNGSPEQAMDYSLESLEIARDILNKNANHERAIRDVALSLAQVGDALVLNDAESALSIYEESLSFRRNLLEVDPTSTRYIRDVSMGLENVGDAHRSLGQYKHALNYYLESLPLAEALADRAPDHAGFARDLEITRARIEVLNELLKKTDPAPAGRSLPSDPG